MAFTNTRSSSPRQAGVKHVAPTDVASSPKRTRRCNSPSPSPTAPPCAIRPAIHAPTRGAAERLGTSDEIQDASSCLRTANEEALFESLDHELRDSLAASPPLRNLVRRHVDAGRHAPLRTKVQAAVDVLCCTGEVPSRSQWEEIRTFCPSWWQESDWVELLGDCIDPNPNVWKSTPSCLVLRDLHASLPPSFPRQAFAVLVATIAKTWTNVRSLVDFYGEAKRYRFLGDESACLGLADTLQRLGENASMEGFEDLDDSEEEDVAVPSRVAEIVLDCVKSNRILRDSKVCESVNALATRWVTRAKSEYEAIA